ncbi:hypothetical protein BgiBS90_034221 [Biomphalaria glabrata]|nr:hypothetical protein BgiBS90_034221 [Biomphalaria glabrata]
MWIILCIDEPRVSGHSSVHTDMKDVWTLRGLIQQTCKRRVKEPGIRPLGVKSQGYGLCKSRARDRAPVSQERGIGPLGVKSEGYCPWESRARDMASVSQERGIWPQ